MDGEGGPAIREAFPWDFTMVVGYAEEWIGYIPTDRAFDNGGYEANRGAWCKVCRGNERILRGQTIDLVAAWERIIHVCVANALMPGARSVRGHRRK